MATRTIGFIGAGHIGSQVARLAISHGYAVVISNSRGPDTLAALVAELGSSARAASEHRRALVIGGDERAAKATVRELLDQFGFDTVDAGPLKEGWRIQRDTPGYGPRRTAEELRKDLAAAKRYADQ